MLLGKLQTKLYLRQSALIGCARKNRWVEEPQNWRLLRGNALVLMAAAAVVTVETPAGYVDLPLHHTGEGKSELIQFRGGKWKEWWEEDIQLLLAITWVYSELRPPGCIVLHEDQGDLTTRYIHTEPAHAETLVRDALQRWERFNRIAKNTSRAWMMCNYCPVKERCDAHDLESGATSDWPKGLENLIGYDNR